MEIPTGDKTYIFLELDKKDQLEHGQNPDPLDDPHLFTNEIDKWIEAIEKVVEGL